MVDCDPPDLPEFLAEANLLPPSAYLKLQNRDLDGNASESDILISLGLIDATRLAQLQSERLGEGYIDLTHFSPNTDLLKILGPTTVLQKAVLPWRLSADVTVILTDRPEHFDQNQSYLRQIFRALRHAQKLPRSKFQNLTYCLVQLDRTRRHDWCFRSSCHIFSLCPTGNPYSGREHDAETHHQDAIFTSWSASQFQV